MRSGTSLLAIVLPAGTIHAQATQWSQCGGMGWTGPTTCVNGWTCTFSNAWYSQCLPGSSTAAATTTTISVNPTISDAIRTTSTTRVSVIRECFSNGSTFPCPTSTTATSSKASSTAVITTSSIRTTSKTTAGSTPTGNYPGPTLLSGNIWIRAVAAPHFHEYLQTSSGTAVIASHNTAGQFQIVSGQLVQYTASGNLYANVEQRSDSSDLLLGVTFSTTQNTFGTFSWSGDALQWNVASISRPNSSAWYVCGSNNQLFINLGQYLYGTPSGCADQTIHFYNGATADL